MGAGWGLEELVEDSEERWKAWEEPSLRPLGPRQESKGWNGKGRGKAELLVGRLQTWLGFWLEGRRRAASLLCCVGILGQQRLSERQASPREDVVSCPLPQI